MSRGRAVLLERGEVVGEHEGAGVVGVASAVGADVARAQVAARVIGGCDDPRRGLARAMPRAPGPAHRHQHPPIEQGVVAPMGPRRLGRAGGPVAGRLAHRSTGMPGVDGGGSRARVPGRGPSPAMTSSWTLAARVSRAASDSPGSVDHHVGLRQSRDGAHADDAPLGVIGHDDEAPAGIHHGAVGLGLEQVGCREARSLVHAVDTHEHEVHVDRSERGEREGTSQGIRGRANASREDDGLVRATPVVQHVCDGHGVGDDRQVRHLEQPACDGVGRGAGGDGDRLSRAHERGRGLRDGLLGVRLELRLGPEPRLEQGARCDGRRAPVHLLQQPLVMQDLEIAPDGHVRHAQLAHEVRHAHGPVGTQPIEDVRVSLTRQHQFPPRGSRSHRTPLGPRGAVSRTEHHKST